MGRTEPSQGLAPPSYRRDARAKKARATINKVIPSLLPAYPRAKRGVESSELIVEPPARRAPPAASKSDPKLPPPANGEPRLVLQVTDTLSAAQSLLRSEPAGRVDLSNKHARVAILNMASPLSPGGGFVNGASSQEESLCMRTTLLPSLKDEFYRLPEFGAVYTPDVLVFRDEEGEDLEKRDRWFVDCVSAAMLRMPETEVDEASGRGRYTSDKDRDAVLRKMRTVMRIFQAKGCRKVVLGAWGCGAYGNPVGEVAPAWRKVLLGNKTRGKTGRELWEGIEEIVFAIKDPALAAGFEGAFGQELTRQNPAHEEEDGETDDDTETLKMKELQDRIGELEDQLQQAKSAQLRAGINSVLVGLRSQLAEAGAESERGEASREDDEGCVSETDTAESSDDE